MSGANLHDIQLTHYNTEYVTIYCTIKQRSGFQMATIEYVEKKMWEMW